MPNEIKNVLEKGEKVMWSGNPQFLPFVVGRSLPTMVFGFIWMAFMLPFALLLGPFVLLFPHFWIGVLLLFGNPLYQFLVHGNIYYAVTNKRVILQRGLIGRDFESADFDQITNADVNVGVFDKLLGKNSGSILISTAGTITYGRHGPTVTPYTFANITDPYGVFRHFKKVSFNVKTDIMYPNRLRPRINPGYNTQYGQKW